MAANTCETTKTAKIAPPQPGDGESYLPRYEREDEAA